MTANIINKSVAYGHAQLIALIKLAFHFLPHWMGYNRSYSFSFNFEPNGFRFGSKSKEKLWPQLYPIKFGREWNASFLSVLRKFDLSYLTQYFISHLNLFINFSPSIYLIHLNISCQKALRPDGAGWLFRTINLILK